MWEDTIVKEVRDARLEIERECDGDFHKIYEHALMVQKKLAKKRISKIGNRAKDRHVIPA